MSVTDTHALVDLALYDVDTQTLIDRAIEHVRVTFPEWEPLESDTAMVVLEALALEVAEAVYAINRVPAAVLRGLLGLYGVDVDPGAAATAAVTFAVAPALEARTIPAGTTVLFGSGDTAAAFTTDVDVVAAPNVTSVTAAVTATTTGATSNGAAAAGDRVDVVDAIGYVAGATVATAPAGGRDVESDDAYLARAAAVLGRLSTALVLPAHFTAAALEVPGVARATTADMHDPTQTPPDSRAGHVTVAVAGPGGAALPEDDRAALEARLDAMAAAMLTVHVVPAAVTEVDVTATITRTRAVTDADAAAAAEAAVRAYLSPDTWAGDTSVYRFELVSVIDAAEGVGRVVSLDTPTGDVPLTGLGALVTPGTITITVTGVAP